MPRPTVASLAADVRALNNQLNTEIALRDRLARQVEQLRKERQPQRQVVMTSEARREAVLRLHLRHPEKRFFTLKEVEDEVLRAVN